MVVMAAWKRAGESAMTASTVVVAPLPDRSDLGALVAAAKAGEAGALGRLFDASRGYLLAIASRRLVVQGGPLLAPSDIVQETAVEAQAAFAGFRGDSAAQFLAWMRSILLHNVGDAMRRERTYLEAVDRFRSAPVAPLPTDLDTARRSPTRHPRPTEASAIRRDDAVLLVRVLDALGDDARMVVRLRYWEGLSFVEIGRRMGRSDNAVRKVWYRAVARLQEALRAAQD